MATPFVTTDNFLAIALVINRSRDGPAFVFHYPPHVQPSSGTAQAPVDFEDILLERLSQPGHQDVDDDGAALRQTRNPEEHYFTESGTQIVPWERVAGFPSRDLAGILTPARSYHKRLFQLSLDPLYCVSYPIHVPENGKWKKAKKTTKSSKRSAYTDDLTASQEHDGSANGKAAAEQPVKDKDGKKDEDDEKRSSMTMFNLVFILNPKSNEVKEVVDAVYDHLIKKVSKAFKYSQQHSEFVWKESKRILVAKDKAREERKKMNVLWKEILQTSSLAAAMHDIFEGVSQNRIATLHLETTAGLLTPSVQIPVPFYVDDLPQGETSAQRGLWITTANTFMSQDALEEPGFLDRNFALLLLDDEKKIISELQADPDPTTASMVEFVRLSKPTLSFHQVGQSNIITVGQVRKYAQHFIFWRRAIAIPPLHARDQYIGSPNADYSQLPQDTLEWQRAFPLAPPLPNFLSELSQCPRPYKHFSPSKAHRPTYLLMLAWLMRRGWVTQLCTFAYVVVWPEILYEVDYEMEAEELRAAADADGARSEDSFGAAPPRTSESSEDRSGTDGSHVPTMTEQAAEKARLERIASKAHREAAEKATAHARKAVPIATAHPSVNDHAHLAGLTPHIILDAKKATGKESRYLSAIARRFTDDKLHGTWQRLSKYFDGQCALERIALQEEMKRKEVWNMLTAMSEHLLCTRHW
ncbi:nitrogen permease regulator of amino acid transport activity 3-domain-containing protein [Dactylonectria estremocensis]|uniref:Nitrogen permease regulator 3 n=1 Tax=Dactylonectria estremocensis TaxID=1079267 RepID=A0A9P9FEW6_9HYPO|nr:nitrogen permease regulator of amino acid transport activity 3-domain-containing protein [Dactylonectria estremocensis]